MRVKKYIGIILVTGSIVLLLDNTNEFKGIFNFLIAMCYQNWPIFILLFGFYLLSTSNQKKRKSK